MNQLTHAPYVRGPPATAQLKNPGWSSGFLATLLPSTIENLEPDLPSVDCMRGWQASFRVPHLPPLCKKGDSQQAGTRWWYKSKV